MDRQIVYPGAIPLETDLLNTNKNAMIGLSKLAAAILGTSTFLNGLACTPTGPASLQVYVAPGEIYSLQNIDGTAYSSIAADTTHAILKQGISLDQLTLSCPAPITAGQSVNYLIQVAYQDTDANAVVLPYYNSSNPSQAYAGPANSGATQNTVRKGVCAVSAKAGVAATTGTQTTPAPDSGYIGAFVVTVAYGQTQITAPNIAAYAGAPFLPSGGLVVGGLQGNACNISAAGGTADAITGSYTPGITALTNGMTLYVRAASANATATPTFTPNSGTIAAKTIVKGNGQAVAAGDIAGGGHWVELQYDLTLDKWVLLNPATVSGSLLNVRVFTASGTYTPTPGTKSVIVEVQGGGGAGGGTVLTGAGQSSIGGGGAAGAYGKGRFTSGFSGVSITVGSAGAGVSGASGNPGGTSSFGALISAPGGNGGPGGGVAAAAPIVTGGGSSSSAPSGANIVSATGASGNPSFALSNGSSTHGGYGGASVFGAGGVNSAGNASGGNNAPSTSYGAGGGGTASGQSWAATPGGNGAPGVVIVWEYA